MPKLNIKQAITLKTINIIPTVDKKEYISSPNKININDIEESSLYLDML